MSGQTLHPLFSTAFPASAFQQHANPGDMDDMGSMDGMEVDSAKDGSIEGGGQPAVFRSSPWESTSMTSEFAEAKVLAELEKISRLPAASSYAQHRHRVCVRALELIAAAREASAQGQQSAPDDELSALLNMLSL